MAILPPRDLIARAYRKPSDMSGHVGRLRALSGRATNGVGVALELGVRGGISSFALWEGLRPGAVLWSVDLNDPGDRFPLYGRDNWTFVQGDDCTAEVVEQIPNQLDLLFIDTSHQRAHTWQELNLYGFRVRPGGYVIGHDAEQEGVIVPFWEFARTTGSMLKVYPESHGLAVIRVSGGH